MDRVFPFNPGFQRCNRAAFVFELSLVYDFSGTDVLSGTPQKKNIFAVIAVMGGLVLIATSGSSGPDSLTREQVLHGLSWGIFASFSFTVLTLLNRKHVQQHHPLTVACWQNGFSCFGSDSVSTEAPMAVQSGRNRTYAGAWFVLHRLRTCAVNQWPPKGFGSVDQSPPCRTRTGFTESFFALILLSEVPSLQTLLGGVLIVGVSILMSMKHGHE